MKTRNGGKYAGTTELTHSLRFICSLVLVSTLLYMILLSLLHRNGLRTGIIFNTAL